MTSFGGYWFVFTILCGVGAFLLGRLTVWTNKVRSVPVRSLLFLAVAILSVFVTVTPALYLGLTFMDFTQQPVESEPPTFLELFLGPAAVLVYYAVLYLCFRMGTGRVHGHG